MPFYDYKCTNCDHIIEVKRSINDDLSKLDVSCPNCEFFGSFEKLISNTNFKLKGKWFKDGGY